MRLRRLLRNARIVIRYRLDRNLPKEGRPWWLMPLLLLIRLRPARHTPAESARLALEELGPIFIKFGQLLSTRVDLFSDEMSAELKKLQDQVPPFDPTTSVDIITRELGRPVDEVFTEFHPVPMASASVGAFFSSCSIRACD